MRPQIGTTEQLARFIVETDFGKLSRETVDRAKAGMLDCLGVSLAGSVQELGKKITSFVEKIGGEPCAGVIGAGFRTSAPNAALVNGTIGHALDYDDWSGGGGHISAVLLPSILALGEKVKASGREAIEAYAVGYDVAVRLGVIPGLRHHGWHATGVGGAMGAAAVAAKLLKLDLEATVMALGIAASQAAGILQNFGTMTKPFHAGSAARNGVIAAMLAEDGFTASRDSIEGSMGYAQVFSRGEEHHTEKITENLGNPFRLGSGQEGDLCIKKYPTCAGTHRALDAILYLINEYDITPDQVEAVECEGSPHWFYILTYPEPKTGLEGKFSLQFCMAIAILDRKVGLEQVTGEKVNDTKTKALINRVSMRAHPGWVEGTNRWEVADKVTVKLKDSREYTREVFKPAGHATLPLSWDELSNKYRECAGMVLKERDIQRSLELMENMEKLADITGLMDIVIASRFKNG